MDSPEKEARGATFPIGDWTARIILTPTGSVAVDYVDPQGKAHPRIGRDAAFQRTHKAALDALKARVTDIEGALREARTRLEQTFRNGRDWSIDDWRERYLDHPLTRTMATRLLWHFTLPDGSTFTALGTAPHLTGLDGATIDLPKGACRVRLWHPVMADAATRQAWRARLLELDLRQPLWQLWRPVYELTEPERATTTYSNRFAGLRAYPAKPRLGSQEPDDGRAVRRGTPGAPCASRLWPGRGILGARRRPGT